MGGSLKGMLTGLVMLVAGLALLFWNEGRAVKTHKALQEGAAAVTEADPARVDAALDGKLVHFSADADAPGELTDAWFGVSARAFRMERTVEMWQWHETSRTTTKENLGGSETTTTEYDYAKGWSERIVDSSKFKVPEGHRNPARFPVEGQEQVASGVTAGAYAVPDGWVKSLGWMEAAQLPPVDAPLAEGLPKGLRRTAEGLYLPAHPKEALREEVATVTNSVKMLLADGTTELIDEVTTVTNLVEAAKETTEPVDPEIGDVRMRLRVAPLGRLSVVAKQEAGGRLGDWRTSNGRTIRMVQTGEAAEKGNRVITWLLRLAGVLLAVFGIRSVLAPLAMLAAVVPFIKAILSAGIGLVSWVLGLALSLVVIGVAWLAYRPLVGVPLLATGIGLGIWLRLGRKGGAAGKEA